MKTGKSIVELATEIARQADTKKDYIVPTQFLTAERNDNVPGRIAVAFTNHARPYPGRRTPRDSRQVLPAPAE